MRLGELIETLESAVATVGRDHRVAHGINCAHSYRGYYEDLAFELSGPSTLGEMLDTARDCMGKTFVGYKGGDFVMGEFTDCWIANYGETGESLGKLSLSAMMNGGAPIPGEAAR